MDWKFVVQLYKRNAGMYTDTPGLSIVPKIKYEHIYLTSFSKMRVDLAAQVSVYMHYQLLTSGIRRSSVHLWLLLLDCVVVRMPLKQPFSSRRWINFLTVSMCQHLQLESTNVSLFWSHIVQRMILDLM